MAKSSFSGFFAEFYDILHAGLEDVGAYTSFASACGPRVLELGSGTGRVLIPLARAGFHVTGVDSSEDMMAVCRERLSYEPAGVQSRVSLVEGDVRDLRLDGPFDLVIAPCNFINYFPAPGDCEKVIRWAARLLGPAGTFLLDNGVPDIAYMRSVDGVTREYEFSHPITGTAIVYRVTSRYNFLEQVEHSRLLLREFGEAGDLLRSLAAEETLKYYFPKDMRSLLESAGLKIEHEQGSLFEDTPVSEDGGEMVFLCRRKDG